MHLFWHSSSSSSAYILTLKTSNLFICDENRGQFYLSQPNYLFVTLQSSSFNLYNELRMKCYISTFRGKMKLENTSKLKLNRCQIQISHILQVFSCFPQVCLFFIVLQSLHTVSLLYFHLTHCNKKTVLKYWSL